MNIDDSLKQLEDCLDKGFPILPGYLVAVKVKDVETLIDRIYASIPQEVQEACAILRRREELQIEAQQKAEKTIMDAQNEAARLLSESDLLRAVQKEAEKIKDQVITDCEEIKHKALEEADNIRNQATDEAIRTKEGAEVYGEQVLTSLENNLTQLQQVVKNGQIYMEKLRSEQSAAFDALGNNYPQNIEGKSAQQNFSIE